MLLEIALYFNSNQLTFNLQDKIDLITSVTPIQNLELFTKRLRD